ncbi:MAG TPA: zinc ribbon domain-containing protein [Casimicrobiaceae bacterium]|nr:zinc ribbon domain-containing protein [Casimicrobiaceae bacterium]
MANDPPSPAPEVDAREKFLCPACGGEATWDPRKQKLVCPFCGTESTAALPATGSVAEHDLAAALRDMLQASTQGPAAAAGGARQVRCRSCNAISVLDPARQAQRCEFCGSAQLVPYAETRAMLRPEGVLPFSVPEDGARDRIRAWYGKLWLAPGALKRRALTDTVKGVYLPYWTFNAHVDATWTAERGHYYWTTETYYENGQPRTRQVRQVRWEAAAGCLAHDFGNELVCGSVGVHPQLMRGVEPFPMTAIKPYDAGYVSGWVVERYQVDLADAAARARATMDAQTRALAGAAVGGDTYRNLDVTAHYSAQTFKHILAPVWLLSYTFGTRAFQCVINGVSGAIAGEYPKSPWKIALLVLAVIVVVIVVASSGGHH